MFDSVQVRFKQTLHRPSPFADTRVVPFVESYLKVLRSVIDDIKTEYFWFFANFMDLKTIDLDTYLNNIKKIKYTFGTIHIH